ncbi:MAG: glycosyltransferase family 2 protein [Acidimicrobiia bacterium]|nr:glycosyltransferase family 2 protein [Acidimicrobiia bacterium]
MSTEPATARPTAPRVVAVVTADDPALLVPCLEAIGSQVYGPVRVIVVGGEDEVRRVAGEREAMWRPNLRAVYDAIGADVDYVWAVRQRARPEPGALAALVQDGTRVDASVAGSKVVEAANPEVLVSVGYATDVFDGSFTGLQVGELDQAQFDVIRDVAAVSDTSMLIRRDLFRGLGGVDPAMPPTSAAVDFCQRARLRGGRVVVIPSSVVRYEGPDPAPRWRERAGETRAMIKAYSPLTLFWALPVAFLVGLAESVLGIFIGRFALPGVLAAGLWNILHLPSALKARFQARRGRAVGDEELFRYQVNGSTRLRALWDEVAERVRARFPEGVLSGFADAVEAGQQRIRNPAFFVGFLVVVFSLVATREIWSERLPIVGYSLLPPDSPTAALGAYAGGWNPAGLGSPEVLRPQVAITALVQFFTLGRSGAAVALITLGSFVFGAFGMSRLVRTWRVGPTAGLLAGVVLMAGPGMVGLTGGSHWSAIPAIAALPWALSTVVGPGPTVRTIAATALIIGWGAAFAPATILVPLLATVLWAAVGVGPRLRAVARCGAATVAAAALLMPWVLYADFGGFLGDGSPAFWQPSAWIVAFIVAAGAGVALTADRVLGSLASWGGLLVALGAIAARSGDFGGGAEMAVFGLAMVSLGTAAIVAAGFDAGLRRRVWGGSAAIGARVGLFAAFFLVVATLGLAGPGRAGLPADHLGSSFRFAVTSDGTANRILLFGPVETLPGGVRTLDGLGYRVIVPPYPRTWEAELNEPRLGDEALEALLLDVLDGEVRRAGSALAEFGIAWIAFTESSPLELLFEAQLDLVPLRSFDFPVFRNEITAASARSADGSPWLAAGTGYRAPAGAAGAVRVASNADSRWGPGSWEQDGWATRVVDGGPSVRFAPYTPRRLMAIASGLWGLALASVWIITRRRKAAP